MTPSFVRAAIPEDIPTIRDLGERAVYQTYVATAMVPELHARHLLETYWTPEQFAHRMTAGEGLVLVCERAGQLIGMTEGAYLTVDSAAMWKLYVRSDVQGQGVGKALLGNLIALLKSTVKTLYTEYLSQNTRAGDFYASQGFVFDREEHETVQGLRSGYIYVKKSLRSTS